ncbi:GNAT family acetyltransferase [Legionella nautarum]|uniref:GNAT family acetyltransferase n=1 Tax=Legionella nautarum TaxID=45070 RepID=A0A0W0WTP8_9GAMM|nr:GNAT family N-acetyltransferase [Legionella nautarum]KTD35693.1 GNAT family acetyltransferase [Legionella nautarum]
MDLEVLAITKEELSWLLLHEAEKEGWLFSEEDVDFCFHYPANELSAIKINGELAGCILLQRKLNFPDSPPIASVGLFLILEKYRGQKKLGPFLWNRAISEKTNDQMIICLNSVARAQNFYERLGLMKTSVRRVSYILQSQETNKEALNTVLASIDQGIIKKIDRPLAIDLYNEKLFSSAKVFCDFIHDWQQRPDALTLAFYEGKEIKGYGIATICKKVNKKLYYRFSPIYADSVEVAETILKGLIYFTLQAQGRQIELNLLEGNPFISILENMGFVSADKDYIFCNHRQLIDFNAPMLNKIFSSLPLEYAHEVMATKSVPSF